MTLIRPLPDSHTGANVSRETFGGRPGPRRRRLALAAGLGIAALALTAACGAAPGPRGWAGAQPVVVDGERIVLVAHKDDLYALPRDSSVVLWQFPPRERQSYPLSTLQREAIKDAIDQLKLPEDTKTDLARLADDLRVEGPTIEALTDAIDAASLEGNVRGDLKSLVEDSARIERDALRKVRALYGDIDLSDDLKTTYVPTFGGWLFALDTQTGEMRWLIDAGSPIIGGVTYEHAPQSGTPPSTERPRVFFGNRDGDLFALDAETGAVDWRFDAGGEIWSAPTIAGDAMYLPTLNGRLYRLDLEGNEVWRFDGADSGIASRPTVAEDTVYVGAFDSHLYAIDTETGAQRWSISADNWFWSRPLVVNRNVYAASLDGKVYAVRADTGERVWDRPFDTGSPVRAAPVVAGGGLIVADRNGEVYKLDLSSGQAIDGSPIQAGARVEANLTTDGENNVFVVPRAATLFVVEAAGNLAASTFPLPR